MVEEEDNNGAKNANYYFSFFYDNGSFTVRNVISPGVLEILFEICFSYLKIR
jgi:hypothetical protein